MIFSVDILIPGCYNSIHKAKALWVTPVVPFIVRTGQAFKAMQRGFVRESLRIAFFIPTRIMNRLIYTDSVTGARHAEAG